MGAHACGRAKGNGPCGVRVSLASRGTRKTLVGPSPFFGRIGCWTRKKFYEITVYIYIIFFPHPPRYEFVNFFLLIL